MTPEEIRRAIENPYLQLEPAWMPAVYEFYSKFADLLRSELGICSTIRDWVRFDGLTLAEFASISRDMRTIANSRKYTYASEILQDLAERIHAHREAIEKQSRLEEQKRLMDTKPSGLRSNLAEAFRMPGTPLVIQNSEEKS